MKKMRLLSLILCLCLVVSCFAACGGDGNTDTTSQGGTANTGSTANTGEFIDKVTGEIVNIGSSDSLTMTLDDIANISNPVITGCEAWPNDSFNKWKEDTLNLYYDYDKVDESQRKAKYISAYVSGDAYDVFWMMHSDFPLVAQNGLLQPIDKILPVYDETLFYQDVTDCFSWQGRVYGVNAWQGVDAYGVHYNQTLFDNAGEKSPIEYYNEGNWTFDNFFKIVKNMTQGDIAGLTVAYNRLVPAAIVANGGSIVTYTDAGAEISLNTPNTKEALEWANKVMASIKMDSSSIADPYYNGTAAMMVERFNTINTAKAKAPNYEFGWIPFPTGPKGTGEQTGIAYAWGICKGAKNVEGALAFITAECYMEQWYEDNGEEYPLNKRYDTEQEYNMYKAAEAKGRMDNTDGFGFNTYYLSKDAETIGVAAAIEKYAPTYQATINEVLSVKKEVAQIDFEDQGVFNFNDTTGDYPFVNVVGDDKVAYGTEEAPSLTIDLTGVDAFAPILYTKPELFNLQNGGQYKVTFKLYCADEVPAETFAVAARTTDSLTEGKTFGLTWLEPKAGEAVDVQVFINVNESFTGDLAVVLLGSSIEANANLKLIIDDFHVELVSDK